MPRGMPDERADEEPDARVAERPADERAERPSRGRALRGEAPRRWRESEATRPRPASSCAEHISVFVTAVSLLLSRKPVMFVTRSRIAPWSVSCSSTGASRAERSRGASSVRSRSASSSSCWSARASRRTLPSSESTSSVDACSSRSSSGRATTSSATPTAASWRCSQPSRAPEHVASLTVIEPPATRVALDDPAVAASPPEPRSCGRMGRRMTRRRSSGMFLRAVGSDFRPPSPLPPELEQAARILISERPPTEAADPARRARGRAVPEARRLGRAPPCVRRDLRRPRARARSRARSSFPATATPSSAIPTSTRR